jgi:hypothetical protein
MLKRIWMLAIILLPLFLTACNGRQVDQCLLGSWGLSGDDMFSRTILPVGSFAPESLTFRGAAGGVIYQFQENGTLAVTVVSWQSRYEVKHETNLWALDLRMEGAVTGEYQLDRAAGTISLVKEKSGGVTYSAVLDGDLMMDSTKPSDVLPLFMSRLTTGKYTCAGDTLELSFPNIPGADKPITFQRLNTE